jgi:uncharacterized coiled-coil DUF342 family protein
MSAEKRTSVQAKSFWPKVYRPNLTKKHNAVVKEYGGAEKVMIAEKKWIWDAFDYESQCKILDDKKCGEAVENRHRSSKRASEYYHHKPAYKTCKYTKTTLECDALNAPDKKLSLQFLRWLLHELDPDKFRAYVLKFPHQVDEENYGYNMEEQHQYIPVDVVQELQQEVRKQSTGETETKTKRVVSNDCRKVKAACAKSWRQQSSVLGECKKSKDECSRQNVMLMNQSGVLTKRLKVLQAKLENAPSRKVSTTEIDNLEREIKQIKQERNRLDKDIKELRFDLETCTSNSKVTNDELHELRANFKQLQLQRNKLEIELKDTQLLMEDHRDYSVKLHEQLFESKKKLEESIDDAREQIAAGYDELAREIAEHYHYHITGVVVEISSEIMRPYLQTASLCKKLEANIKDDNMTVDQLIGNLVSTRKKIFGFNGLLK